MDDYFYAKQAYKVDIFLPLKAAQFLKEKKSLTIKKDDKNSVLSKEFCLYDNYWLFYSSFKKA